MSATLQRLARSLTIKLVAVFFVTAVLLTWLLWVSLGITFKQQFSENISPYLRERLIRLQAQVGIPPNIIVAKAISEQEPVIIVIDAPGYSWSSNGQFIDTQKLDVKLQQLGSRGLIAEAGVYQGNFILRTYNQGYITSFIITEKINQKPSFKAAFTAIVAILIIIAALYSIIYYLFSPIKRIERGVRRIGNGDVSYRLNINRNDEIGFLANSVNKMADNIEQMLEAKRQLLLAISHELRTPITRAKIALSLLEDSNDKASAIEDMDEMETLIYELLESEKLRGNHAPLSKTKADINELIYQVQGRFFADAPLILNLEQNLPGIAIDAKYIGLAIKNLINNAITASIKNTDKVIISTILNEHNIAITVSDSGTGIAAKDIPHLVEPFYRPDHSRRRATGGFGIGLYLIKAIVDAHQGELNIDSDLNRGTCVTLILPIEPASNTKVSDSVHLN